MEIKNIKTEMHTASGLIEVPIAKRELGGSEEGLSSQRRGRKGAAQAAQGPDSGASDQYRVVITKDANEGLESAIAKTNRGFDGCTLSRSDIANFVFKNLNRLLSDSDIKALRSLHFDDKKILHSIIKSDIELPEEVRRALREHFGVTDSGKRRPLRSVELSTASDVDIAAAK